MTLSEEDFFNTSFPLPPTAINYDSDNLTYIILGIPIILVNLFVFAVLIHDRILIRKSAFIAGVTVGNLYLGLHMVSFGAYRYHYGNPQHCPTTLARCALMLFPFFYSIAFITESMFLVLAGLELWLAVGAPNWYRINSLRTFDFGGRIAAQIPFPWLISALGHATVLVTLVLGLSLPANRNPYNWSCDMPSLFGLKYIQFLVVFSCLGGLASTILTLSALVIGLYQFRKLPFSSDEASRVRKQVQLAKSIAAISTFDLALVTLPSLFSLLAGFNVSLPSFVRVQNSTYTYAINCMMVFLALMVFNRRFRQASAEIMRIGKMLAFMKSWCEKHANGILEAQNKVTPAALIEEPMNQAEQQEHRV